MPMSKSAHCEVRRPVEHGDPPEHVGQVLVSVTVMYPGDPAVTMDTITEAFADCIDQVTEKLVKQGVHEASC